MFFGVQQQNKENILPLQHIKIDLMQKRQEVYEGIKEGKVSKDDEAAMLKKQFENKRRSCGTDLDPSQQIQKLNQ